MKLTVEAEPHEIAGLFRALGEGVMAEAITQAKRLKVVRK